MLNAYSGGGDGRFNEHIPRGARAVKNNLTKRARAQTSVLSVHVCTRGKMQNFLYLLAKNFASAPGADCSDFKKKKSGQIV